ncbi:MAG: ribosome biogenesis GTPase YlqF [Candidatus Improbicoccus devescovinae]|nr:MAG: ribosome biogenesis GTPase YlqF [Candidatus Improbicoccus devescovinae]
MNNINWYPGHMVGSERNIKKNLKIVDVILEIIDARIPISSRSEFLSKINTKPVILIMNKIDLADDNLTQSWIDYFKQNGNKALAVNNKQNINKNLIINSINDVLQEKKIKYKSKGMINKLPKVIVVGVPNVGKSAFINNILGSHKTKVENRAGVTMKTGWFNLKNRLDICDTPGILPPRMNPKFGNALAFLGLIKDKIFDKETIVFSLIDFLKNNKFLKEFLVKINKNMDYSSEIIDDPPEIIIEKFGKSRQILKHGGKIDMIASCERFLNDFRKGKFGKITLEFHDKYFMKY